MQINIFNCYHNQLAFSHLINAWMAKQSFIYIHFLPLKNQWFKMPYFQSTSITVTICMPIPLCIALKTTLKIWAKFYSWKAPSYWASTFYVTFRMNRLRNPSMLCINELSNASSVNESIFLSREWYGRFKSNEDYTQKDHKPSKCAAQTLSLIACPLPSHIYLHFCPDLVCL